MVTGVQTGPLPISHAHLRQACTAFVIEMAAEHAAIGQSRPVTDTARGRAVQVAVMAMQHDLARNCHITGNETAGRWRGAPQVHR
ncbi:hypothetical protein G6F23_015405 [Rhizopus arrhizus]|nr:hypothetical protein G6F23_015405 [Rhizopus arrhizus]